MAKEQNLPLTPSKLTGVCGRLMCCLSYELGTYRAKTDGIPCVGEKVMCCGHKAKVEKIDIFKEEVLFLTKDGQVLALSFDEVKKEVRDVKKNNLHTERCSDISQDDLPPESDE
jgi:cell fate regulator YaaT (PSP1 superfamily)